MVMLLYADASCPPLANSNACEPRYLGKFGLGKILATMRHSINAKIEKNGSEIGE